MNSIWAAFSDRLTNSPKAARSFRAVVVADIDQDELLSDHHERLLEQKYLDAQANELLLKETARVEDRNRLDSLADPQATSFINRLEAADWLAEWAKRAGLTESEAEVIQLKQQEYSDAEIAKFRGCATGTVKTLLFRAKQKLNQTRR